MFLSFTKRFRIDQYALEISGFDSFVDDLE